MPPKTVLLPLLAMFFLLLPYAARADSVLPVENGVITSGVGLRVDPFGSGKLVFHHGVDIAVPVGTPVKATRKGHVVFAGERNGYGATVVVEHSNGDRTLYGHNSLLRVKRGDPVDAGTVIAFSGNSGRSTGPHVHYEQIASGRPIVEPADNGTVTHRIANNNQQRDRYERQMDESVDSILRTIGGFGVTGQGG